MTTLRRVPLGFRVVAVVAITAIALIGARTTLDAVHDLGIFELEGNAIDDPSRAGDDWSTVNFGGGAAVARTGVLADPAPQSIYTGGGSKDPEDISSWKHKDGSVPDKDDITNAYAAAYNVNGDLVIYFGADRFANDGDAQLGFWFFQQNVTRNVNGTFNGTHTVGDILVLANFSQGGAQATIQVLEWVGSGGDQHGGTLQLLESSTNANCTTLTGEHHVCAATNPGPVASPWPYTPKQGQPGIFPTFSFFEGGINITQIFAGTTAPCFASFLAETRSSTSVTAVLKDFVLGSFPVCGIDIAKDCTAGALGSGENTFVWSFSGTVTNTGFAPLHDVTVVDDAGTPDNPADDQTIPLGTLGPQATVNYSGTFESTQNPPTNSVTVTAATTQGGPATVSDTASDTCPPVQVTPHIDVSKNCVARLAIQNNTVVVRIDFGGTVCAGDQISLTNVTVTDDHAGQVFSTPLLAKGTCQTYSGSYFPTSANPDPVLATFTDTVTASGTASLGFGTATDTATATCPLCPPEPH
jgi:hypothetical protein